MRFSGAMMSDARCQLDSGLAGREGAGKIVQVHLRMGDHAEVRDLDAPRAGDARHFDAAAEAAMCAGHTTARIFGVAQSAQGARFQLGQTGRPCALQRHLVLAQTFGEPA